MICSLSGVTIQNWHTRRLQDAKLSHEAAERSKERQMGWRREVFLDAASAVSRLSAVLGQIADLSIPDLELSQTFQESYASLFKVYVIGSDQTIAELGAFTQEYSATYLKLNLRRSEITARNREVAILKEKFGNTISEIHSVRELLAGLKAGPEMQEKRTQLQSEWFSRIALLKQISDQKDELTEQLARVQFELLRDCMNAAIQMNALVTAMLIAVRGELDFPFDAEKYKNQSNELTAMLKGTVDEALESIAKTANHEFSSN